MRKPCDTAGIQSAEAYKDIRALLKSEDHVKTGTVATHLELTNRETLELLQRMERAGELAFRAGYWRLTTN